MKKIFTEPEIEILSFLCNDGADSYTTGGSGASGGALDGDQTDTQILG